MGDLTVNDACVELTDIYCGMSMRVAGTAIQITSCEPSTRKRLVEGGLAAELGLPGGAGLDVRVVDPQFLRHVPADKPRRAAEVVGPRPGAAGDLYVGNLPRDVVAADLVRVFGNFGAVEDVRIATSPKGRLLGFAYVTMADGAEAEAAVRKLRDYVWDGFPVHIRRTEAGGGNGGKNR